MRFWGHSCIMCLCLHLRRFVSSKKGILITDKSFKILALLNSVGILLPTSVGSGFHQHYLWKCLRERNVEVVKEPFSRSSSLMLQLRDQLVCLKYFSSSDLLGWSVIFQRTLQGRKKGLGMNVDAGCINRVVYRKQSGWSCIWYPILEAGVFYSLLWHIATPVGPGFVQVTPMPPILGGKSRVVPFVLGWMLTVFHALWLIKLFQC